ncbi:ABC transporter substrate-binding protein [Paenibacillus thermotolerans]|uniref:ABC transporter substrate-binding protein n=1 Tax=Paenibacillus thermotolerans TaxID=3027807 RepID=UPI002368A18F|nr:MULTISPECIES: ABC transporter substrate-binding protein [unclassified Paenibacillus]
MKLSRKVLALVAVAALTVAVGCGQKNAGNGGTQGAGGGDGGASDGKKYKIGISQIVEHPSLDATREGFLAALKDNGLIEGQNLEVKVGIAQGDGTNNITIAQGFKNDKVDLALGISTPSAQAIANELKDVPVLFTAVTDPVGAGLVENPEAPGGNITGVSDTHPDEIPKLMEFIGTQFPNVKTLGTVINAGEQNSVASIEMAQKALDTYGIKIEKATVTSSADVKQAAESLIGRVDAIYIPKDNTVVSSLEAVIGVANNNKLPLFAGDVDSVNRGSLATFGYQYYDIGYTTGKLAADILLNGKKAGDIPVKFPEQLDLYMNETAAEKQGVEITQAMKDLIGNEEHIVK